MKNISLSILLTTLLFTVELLAQRPIQKGGKQLNFGSGAATNGIPIYLGADLGLHKDISIGAIVSYRHFNGIPYDEINTTNLGNYDLYGIGVSGDYHFNSLLNVPDKFDIYAGLTIGHTLWFRSNDYDTIFAFFNYSAHAGGRLFFQKHWGIHIQVEAGTEIATLAGVTYKI